MLLILAFWFFWIIIVSGACCGEGFDGLCLFWLFWGWWVCAAFGFCILFCILGLISFMVTVLYLVSLLLWV